MSVEDPPIRDILLGELIDYSPKDSTDMMQRPFFSLSKRKRLKPIEYNSPDGTVQIKVTSNAAYGMATIWDADILIWLISKIVARRNRLSNDLSPVVHTSISELLTGIGRGIGGANYKEIMAAIQRLRTTEVQTTIRAAKGRKHAAFHYLGDFEGQGPEDSTDLNTLSLRVSDWLLQGIEDGHYVTIDKEYYRLTGGIERAVYRVARKHAGAQEAGWTCRISQLHEKTGSEATLKDFAHKLRKIIKADELPRYTLSLTATKSGEAAVHFIDRMYLDAKEVQRRDEQRLRRQRDHGREAWDNAGRPGGEFEKAWETWIDKGLAPGEFADNCASPQPRLV